MSEQAPGWYADPRGAGSRRWWDGSSWTSWLARDADAPPPSADLPFDPAATDSNPPTPPVEGPRVSRPAAVLAVIAAVIAGVLVVGLVVWASEPRVSPGPAVAPPPPNGGTPVVSYTAGTRAAQIAEARLTLPAEPYACEPAPSPRPTVFTSLITCSTVVHQNYNAKGDDWVAVMGFGVLDQSLVIPGDLTETGQGVFRQLRSVYFKDQATKVEQFQSQTVDLGSTPSAQSHFGNVTYRLPGLSSTYDRLVVIVVPLTNGEIAVVFSDRPNDLPKATLDRLNASIGSLTARK